MLTEFSAERFRSLRSIHLEELKRINVIVGRSGSGKTAILEAIRVGLGAAPAILWNAAGWRGGMQFGPQGQSNEQFEALWRPYFFDFDTSESMTFKFRSTKHQTATVRAFFDHSAAITSLPLLQPGMPAIATSVSPFVFDRFHFNEDRSQVRALLNQGQLHFDQASDIGIQSELISASVQLNAPQIATWYSNLSVEDNEHEIIEVIRDAFPEVDGISVQSPQGISLLYASLRTKSRKLPVSSVSSGLNKLVAILVAIRTFAGGVVLIDEIENGIYYEMFPMLWRSLSRLATISNTQLIVTTHSAECLKAAFGLDEASSFSMYQVHQDNGETKAHFLAGSDAASAIELGIEVRQ